MAARTRVAIGGSGRAYPAFVAKGASTEDLITTVLRTRNPDDRPLGDVQLQVETLLQGYQVNGDRRVYMLVQLLNRQLHEVTKKLSVLVDQNEPILVVSSDPVLPALGFSAVSTGQTIRLSWMAVTSDNVLYEVRLGEDWDTATLLFRIAGLQADIDALPYGTYTFLLKTLSSGGVYSTNSVSTSILIPQIDAVVIGKSIIDNNVLLTWAVPVSTFEIKEYELYKDGVSRGTVKATFAVFFEVVGGDFTYSIIARDIVGNESIEAFIAITVNTPPDYDLQDQRISDLSGTRVNVSLDVDKLICCTVTETWQDHFINNGWANIQAQIDAGYPIYIEPSETTGSYEERIDYGVALNNIIATITYNAIPIVGDVSVVIKMSVSDDDITYSAYTSGASQFFEGFRYFKFKFEFTGLDDKSLLQVYNITTSINVKREVDGGTIDALSTDVGGTEVLFNKAFKDIESITATVKSTTEPFICIFDFTDIPNPVHFFVYVFDTTGNRVSKTVDWKVRGIV